MKLKKILLLIGLSTFVSTGVLASNQHVKITIDGETFKTDVPAQIVNGRTLVPVRPIFEKYGMEVTWYGKSNIVQATKDGYTEYERLTLIPIDSNVGIINDGIRYLDQPAVIIKGSTMVPLRVISEALEFNVEWDQKNKSVIIKTAYDGKEKRTPYEKAVDDLFSSGELESRMAKGYGDQYNRDTTHIKPAFHDIDGDGVQELLLQVSNYDSINAFIYEFKNGKMNALIGEISKGTVNFSREDFYYDSRNKEFFINKSYKGNPELYRYDKKNGQKLVFKENYTDFGPELIYIEPGFSDKNHVRIEPQNFRFLK